MNNNSLSIKLVRSLIGRTAKQRKVVQALGLGRIGSTVIMHDNAATRGMTRKVGFLLEIKTLS